MQNKDCIIENKLRMQTQKRQEFFPMVFRNKTKNWEIKAYNGRVKSLHNQAEIPELIRNYYSKYQQTIKPAQKSLSVSINFKEISQKELQKIIEANKEQRVRKYQRNLHKEYLNNAQYRLPPTGSMRYKKNKYQLRKQRFKTLNLSPQSRSCESIKDEQRRQMLEDKLKNLKNLHEKEGDLGIVHERCLKKIEYIKKEFQKGDKGKSSLRTKKKLKKQNLNCVSNSLPVHNPEEQRILTPWKMEDEISQKYLNQSACSQFNI